MLEYENCQVALQTNVKKEDLFYLRDIVKNYKILYKNVQGHTKFLNEPGLYSLILKSKKKKATPVFDWITHEVMPSIREYGEYKTKHSLKKQIDELNDKIEKQSNEIGVLKHNLKKPKFKKGGMIYILRTIDDTIKLNIIETLYLKFGRRSNPQGENKKHE